MRLTSKLSVVVATLLLATACASTAPKVDPTEPRRVVGTESDVRLDAEVDGEVLAASQRITFRYDVTNNRPTPIAIAELIPIATYDSDTQTVTINIGSEVPGQEFLPRLVTVLPGERKSFTAIANVSISMPNVLTPLTKIPNQLRLKLNFLGDTAPFEKLIAIPERGIRDAKLADQLFPLWIESNEVVFTNILPMRWAGLSAPSGAIPLGGPGSEGTGMGGRAGSGRRRRP